MEHLVTQLPVEGEVPAGMVTEPLDGLPVGDRLQILQQAHAQQQNRFEGHTAIVGTVTTLPLGTSAHEHRMDLLGKKPVAVSRAKQAAGAPGRGKEFRLGGEDGQAHNLARDKANAMRLLYGVAIKTLQAEFEMKVQVIRSQGRATRLFVNIPLPLAAALDLQAAEPVRWQLLTRSELRLIRLAPPPVKKRPKK